MRIKNITITNFKSIYGTQTFDFDALDGLIKLSGPIGSGKTTLAEAILYGLYGNVKGQNISQLIAWNEKTCSVEMNIISKNKEVHIIRDVHEPLFVEVNKHVLPTNNKRDTQSVLEEEVYDVPKLAVIKMCVISFNQFNSLADMSAGETKQFLDEIFGFRLFTQYNDEITNERKLQQNESTRLNAIITETANQIVQLRNKKEEQERQINSSVDLVKFQKERNEYVEKGKALKDEFKRIDSEYSVKEKELADHKLIFTTQKNEYKVLGKQEKDWVNTFKTGKCPTCGNDIDVSVIEEHKNKMMQYAALYKEQESKESEVDAHISSTRTEHSAALTDVNQKMNDLKDKIHSIDLEVSKYNNAIKLISENYDMLIAEYQEKLDKLDADLTTVDHEIGEWNEMGDLFTKTFRYNMLNQLIPHINKSIQYFINKLDQSYKIEYDQEFKPHIFVESFDKEIAYNNLSTGQRKSLDIAIIFGVLQNVISSVNFNVFVLDELFSNMDVDTRNIMLELLNETMGKDKSVFIINHAEMNDDYFNHKIRVSLHNKKISTKKQGDVVVKSSKYEQIF